MKKILVLMVSAIVTTGVISRGRAKYENGSRIVLPNSKLLGCRSSGCFQLWQDNPAQANAIYPRQVTIDIFGNDKCPRGILALYEKSVSTDEIKAALDQSYGKWALADFATSPVKLWRVEPEKFAIQLAITDDRTKEVKRDEAFAFALSQVFEGSERSNVAEGGHENGHLHCIRRSKVWLPIIPFGSRASIHLYNAVSSSLGGSSV